MLPGEASPADTPRDVVVLDEAALAADPLWEKQPVRACGQAIRLVVEVVSTNWQDDYALDTPTPRRGGILSSQGVQ